MGQAQAQQGDDAAPAAAADVSNYGAQQEYAPQQESYGHEEYAAPPVTKCLGSCPSHAPCMDRTTGACSPKAYGMAYQPQYAQSANDYGGQTMQQNGYRVLQSGEGSCPPHTKDTNDNRVTKRWPLWTGFALLFIPALWFLCAMFGDLTDDGSINGSNLSPEEEARFAKDNGGLKRVVAGFICMVASLAYLTMATGHGFITRCCDGRSFYYARYIDWMITTPLMLWELSSLAQDFGIGHTDVHFWWLFFLDILMIAAGLIGSLLCGSEKWAFWGFSVLCFIPILVQLCGWDTEPAGTAGNEAGRAKYKRAMNITVVTWFFYPIVWIFAEGNGTLSANGEAIAYTVLDIIAKSVFGFVCIQELR